MLQRLVRSRVTIAIVAAALGATAVGGFALASIPSSTNGQITACYLTSGANKGQVRVVDYQAGERCRAGEAPLGWQQRGLRFRGAWSSTTGYTRDDLVTDRGGVFVAVVNNTARRPAVNAIYWALISPALARCSGYPRPGVDWSSPGSSLGNGCDFHGAVFDEAQLQGANLTNANLSGVRFDCEREPVCANFTGANLIGASLANARVGGVVSQDKIDLTNADLTGADLTGAFFICADLTNANFTNANLTGSAFGFGSACPMLWNEVVWSNTTCSDGTNSDANGGTCEGHLN